ncbi:dna polymerase zeta subunit [Stylonychia lemnae]|uniref:DNA polymerase n=1 Tax=Stylonychia lemnae TaxID=5949 RepID=A0A077ZYS1_STYLE|nr:dna polymerase zeta subunit [Stylonychia lemnae]|eukprot:CDW73683.1 dna polymerase zeta subunit [Stylonychia lemnae]
MRRMDLINSVRDSIDSSLRKGLINRQQSFDQQSFSIQDLDSQIDNMSDSYLDQINKTPDFKLDQLQSDHKQSAKVNAIEPETFDQQFLKYSLDIKEVKSLVNLWKEEFVRRKHQKLPELERAQMKDDSRLGGYSESINKDQKVIQYLLKHLRTKTQNSEKFETVDNSMYKEIDIVDYEALQMFIQSKEELQENEGDLQERYQMLGFFNMRQMQEARHQKAVQKNFQQQVQGLDEEEKIQQDEVEVLDIMESLKDQYDNIMNRVKDHRQAKAKYKTGKIGSDIQNNKSIFDYMSPDRSKRQQDENMTDVGLIPQDQTEQSEYPELDFIDLLDIDSNATPLIDENMLFNDEESDDIQGSMISMQNNIIKQSKIGRNFDLEEVKEEMSEESMRQQKSQHTDKISDHRNSSIGIRKSGTEQDQTEFQPRYILKGDKIIRVRAAREKQPQDYPHLNAHFSEKKDLLEHLIQLRQVRQNRNLQLKDTKIFITEKNKYEIKVDEKVNINTVGNYIEHVTNQPLRYNKLAPTSKQINKKYQSQGDKDKYQRHLIQDTDKKADIDQKLKQEAKRDLIIQNMGSAENRFITPATQYNIDSQNNMGGFEKQRQVLNNEQQQTSQMQTLFDLHQKFDLINGITQMIIEVFVQTREGCAVFYVIHNECAELDLEDKYNKIHGVIVNKQASKSIKSINMGTHMQINESIFAKNEVNLFQKVIDIFRYYDPDIVTGYETEAMSIGYICKRAEKIGIQMSSVLSRTPMTLKPLNESFYNQKLLKEQRLRSVDDQDDIQEAYKQQKDQREDKKKMSYFYNKFGQAIKLNGRIIINLWTILRHEINLTNYDLENVCFNILKKREPRYDYDTQSQWWMKGQFYNVASYQFKRLLNIYSILETMDLINRDINMAKVYGIDYESVMTRGSQFRVEAILSRITKSQDYLLLSAAVQQVRNQNELEVIPLVVEPDKLFYTSPVIIVDFQSLYPSVIIAYNLCYSTCLGKIIQINPENNTDQRKLGVYVIPGNIKSFFGIENDQDLTPEQEQYILDNIIIAPNLNCFVKPHLRLGLLPRMLREILYTRIMVKKSMKLYQPGSITYRMLDSRQLALKLIANVTYGYTAAGFSGRMPCSELADSVVAIGRHTLERCMKIVNQNEETWGTRVVYGDTDSTFILCEGRTLEDTFRIGEIIAKTMTEINPFPMELKLEKVYYPCVTLAKKRYCGYKMEKITDTPVLDAKGIETIRRDTVEAVAKIMDKCLRLLFETKDLTQIKSYLIKQWTKIQNGDVEFKDFIFAKEVRLGTYRVLPPSAIICERRLERDPGAMPRYKERIPYVIAMGQGGAIDQSKIKDLVLSPEEFLSSDGLLLNANYYIRRQINAALNRIFLEIFDIDVNQWFNRMPKLNREQGIHSKKIDYFQQQISSSRSNISKSKLSSKLSSRSGVSSTSIAGQNSMMIDQFYQRKNCIVCGDESKQKLCKTCTKNVRETIYILNQRLKNLQNQLEKNNMICLACSNMLLRGRVAQLVQAMPNDGISDEVVPCLNYQCRIFYEKMAFNKEYAYLKDAIEKININQI